MVCLQLQTMDLLLARAAKVVQVQLLERMAAMLLVTLQQALHGLMRQDRTLLAAAAVAAAVQTQVAVAVLVAVMAAHMAVMQGALVAL
jgi:hypothetical protein